MHSLVISTLSLTLLVIASQDITEAIRKDKTALQGTWKIIVSERNGEKTDVGDLCLVFRGDAILIRESGKAQEKFSFLLDPLKKPKEIDLTFTTAPRKGQTDRAIYTLEGDKLAICIQENKDGPRPREFTTRPASNLSLVFLQRVKE